MLWVAVSGMFVTFFSTLLDFLPKVTTLPSMFGFDIDTALTTGMASFYSFIQYIWPIKIVFQGFLVLLAYHGIKLIAKAILGSRAPA